MHSKTCPRPLQSIILLDSYRFRQVPRAINVTTAENRDVEGQKLHGNDCENPLKTIHRFGHLENSVCERFRFVVAFLADNDWLAVSRCNLLQGVHAFL